MAVWNKVIKNTFGSMILAKSGRYAQFSCFLAFQTESEDSSRWHSHPLSEWVNDLTKKKDNDNDKFINLHLWRWGTMYFINLTPIHVHIQLSYCLHNSKSFDIFQVPPYYIPDTGSWTYCWAPILLWFSSAPSFRFFLLLLYLFRKFPTKFFPWNSSNKN